MTNPKNRKQIIRIIIPVPVDTPPSSLPDGFVTVDDAASYLQVGPETVRRSLANGTIQGEQEEGSAGHERWRWLIPTEELLRLREIRNPLEGRKAALAS